MEWLELSTEAVDNGVLNRREKRITAAAASGSPSSEERRESWVTGGSKEALFYLHPGAHVVVYRSGCRVSEFMPIYFTKKRTKHENTRSRRRLLGAQSINTERASCKTH